MTVNALYIVVVQLSWKIHVWAVFAPLNLLKTGHPLRVTLDNSEDPDEIRIARFFTRVCTVDKIEPS